MVRSKMKHQKSKILERPQKSIGFPACDECNGKVVRKKVDFALYDVSLGKFEAEVCTKCGEELFSEEASGEIDKVAKKRGLWGLESSTKIGKAGDSLIIRVNKKFAEFYGLKKGEEVTLAPENKNKFSVVI